MKTAWVECVDENGRWAKSYWPKTKFINKGALGHFESVSVNQGGFKVNQDFTLVNLDFT